MNVNFFKIINSMKIEFNIDLLSAEPVCSLTGREFEPIEGVTFVEQVAEYFAAQGGRAASVFGEVLLDRKGVQNSRHHGMSAVKRAAFAAVKDVLEQGVVILPMGHHRDNKREATGMISAPITIAGERYLGVVVVIWNLQVSRLYVHEAFIIKKLQAVVADSPSSEEGSSLTQPQGDVAKVVTEFLKNK